MTPYVLAFITPELTLVEGANYTITINGAIDQEGLLVPLSGLSFTTAALSSIAGPSGTTFSGSATSSSTTSTSTSAPSSRLQASFDSDWYWTGALKDGKPHSPWQDLPALQAGEGVTALAGQVLDLKGDPLANVTLVMEGMCGGGNVTTQTDKTGRFLLQYIDSGWCEFIIDGRSANTAGKTYGVFEVGIEIQPSQTNVLPYTIWMPWIDTADAVTISSPTISDAVVTTPKIQGLEVHIPQDTVIYNHEGEVVTEVSITPIPIDRPPFPLPENVEVPIYFTVQPGGAYIHGPHGARIIYPNYTNRLSGTRFNFWHYEPEYKGWYIYGLGTVTEDGKQVVPDPGLSIYEFTGAMVADDPNFKPPEAPPQHEDPKQGKDGDPVDLFTGLMVVEKTDLVLPDILPITLTRTYRPRDTFSRAFGIGASHSYDMFLFGDVFPYTFAEVILPDGGQIHYDRISAGTNFFDAVYEHVLTPTRFYKSIISWNGNGWDLKLRDGTVYVFLEGFNATRPGQSGLIGIRDRHGNSLTIGRDTNGNVTQITSPNGRWVEFTNDASNRITQAKDHIGRVVTYTYDATGRLSTVTDAEGGVTEYTYDASQRMVTIKDARGIVYLTNEYDASGKVIKQTQADLTTYQFAYTEDVNGNIIQTDVTDPRGNVRRVAFNADGYILTDTRALGTSEEQTTVDERQAGTNLLLSRTDALSRKTAYTYDSLGNVTSVTRLAGTPEAVTTSFTYESTFNQVASVTNPLSNTTSFTYDQSGNLTTVTDPLSNATNLAYNTAGQPTSITDPLGSTTQLTYDFGDLAAVTDPLGNTASRFIDSAGRLITLTNPLGQLTRYDYDGLNRLTQVTDPLGSVTAFGYDANGNLLSLTDAGSSVTSYTYNNMDQLATRTDPLLNADSYQYDAGENLTQFTDRKSQATTSTYDALNRRTQATYADLSTTTYKYDAGNRLTQVVDSISGTITRSYDDLDRLTSETTPEGTVSYAYDDAGRRTSMTVAGQPTVNYTYDNANRLTQITKGTSTVSFTYDLAGRRTSLTLPNGVLVEYSYDAASRVTGITYKLGATVLGGLTYAYNAAGNRTKIGGSFARTGIPDPIASATYNAANQQLALGDKTMTYDENGNLLDVTDAGGTTTYTWDARNRLASMSGPGVSASFEYDPFGRRVKKTIGANPTEFLYDGFNPVQEADGATILSNILSGLGVDEFLTRTETAGTMSFLPDGLGSTVALADNTGTVQTEYTYEPFGGTTVAGVTSTNPFQYTGRENDGTGLYYYRARYYHPELQRFISEDPIRIAGGAFNLYAYVANNPVNFIDPTGRFIQACRVKPDACVEIIIAVIGSILEAIDLFSGSDNNDSGNRETPPHPPLTNCGRKDCPPSFPIDPPPVWFPH